MRVIHVTTQDQWDALKSLLAQLFAYENSLRPDRKSAETNINGGFSYVQRNIAEHEGAAFIIYDGETPIAFVNGWVILGDGLDSGDNRLGYISDAFVVEEHRGRGLFKKLVESMKDHYQANGITKLYIDTLGTNKDMQAVLTKSGFKPHKIFYEMDIT